MSKPRNHIIRSAMVLLIGVFFLFSAVGLAGEKDPIVIGSIWDLVGFGGEIGKPVIGGLS